MQKLANRKNGKKRGFTLIELIVVIAILGILAAILVPTMLGIISDSRAQVNLSNSKMVYNAAKSNLTMLDTAGTVVTQKTYTQADVVANGTDIASRVSRDLGTGFGNFSFTVGEENGVLTITVASYIPENEDLAQPYPEDVSTAPATSTAVSE